MFAARVKGPKVFQMFARNARRAAEVAGLFWSVGSKLGEKYHVLEVEVFSAGRCPQPNNHNNSFFA